MGDIFGGYIFVKEEPEATAAKLVEMLEKWGQDLGDRNIF